MKKAFLLVVFGVIFTALIFYLALRSTALTPSEKRPFILGQAEIIRFLNDRGNSVSVVDTVMRNSSGEELYVILFPTDTNACPGFRITTEGVTKVNLPGRRVYAPTDDHFAAWLSMDGRSVVFSDGNSIALPQFGLFDLDLTGRYFVVGEKPTKAWIGRANSPGHLELLGDDILASRIFVKGQRIFVCGITPRSGAVCLVVQDEESGFRIIDRHTLNWAAGIVDLDPDSMRLLLWNNSDLFTSVYEYDLVSKKRNRIGAVKAFDLFLKHDLLRK